MSRTLRRLLTAVLTRDGRAEMRRRSRWCRLIWLTDYPRGRPAVCSLRGYGGFIVHPGDAFSLEIYLSGGYERLETKTLVTLLAPGDGVMDAGANIGYYTILASRLVGPQGRVIAFEPAPAACARLRTAVDILSLGNVNLRAEAVGSVQGPVEIHLSTLGREAQQSLEPWSGLGEGAVPYTVPCVTLEAACADEGLLGRVALLKLDLEGGEVAALEGGAKLLGSADRPMVMVEVNAEALRAHGKEVGDLPGFFGEYDCWGVELGGMAKRLARWDWPSAPLAGIFNVVAIPRSGRYAARADRLKEAGLLEEG